jgi:hypothetical protein
MKPKPKPKKPKHANVGNKHAQRGPARRVPVFVRLDPADLATLKNQAATRGLSQSDTVAIALNVLKSSPMTSPDDLNDIACAAVDSIHGACAPSTFNDDERDEWRETAGRLFLAACQAISGDMNEATAKDSALGAVRKASK